MVLSHLYVEGRTVPYRTPLRSPSKREADGDGRRSGSTALTTSIGANPFHHKHDATSRTAEPTSENAVMAKFAELFFHALRRIRAKERARDRGYRGYIVA